MPEKRKETRTCPENRTCHDCGLEDYESCEGSTPSRHLPDDEGLIPCKFCLRNPRRVATSFTADLFCENWLRDDELNPWIEDADPNEQEIMRTLHAIVNNAPQDASQKVRVICQKIEMQKSRGA